jgi:hypothetical protein
MVVVVVVVVVVAVSEGLHAQSHAAVYQTVKNENNTKIQY